ncbi:MAG: hypothetical protein H0T63_10700, partial [Pyrinomonadaceae bacterium]|nr:hypothetical protein [Pyrinomonadaceae bacterium]
MKRFVVCILALFLSLPAQCVFVLAAPIVQDAELQYPLLNKDIASMVKAKIAPEVIVAKIKSSRCHFDTTPSVLAEMKQGGISNEVLMAMIEAPYGSPKPVAKPRPKPRQQEADEASETEDVGEGSFLLLPEAMEFTVTPTQEINSKQAVEGELVTFRVVNSVVVKGQKVIAGGAIARGTVTDVEKRGMLGKAGKLSIRIDS